MSAEDIRVEIDAAVAQRRTAPARRFVPCRTIVLVGLMGAGKSKIGRRLAARLTLPFFDSDHEIEMAAGESIEERQSESRRQPTTDLGFSCPHQTDKDDGSAWNKPARRSRSPLRYRCVNLHSDILRAHR